MTDSSAQFRKTWRNLLIYLFINVAFVFVLIANTTQITTLKKQTPLILFAFLLVYVVGMNAYFYKLWRCPSCKKMLPFNFKKPTTCAACGTKLS